MLDAITIKPERIETVMDTADLFGKTFNQDVNCIVFPRSLRGDFNALAVMILRNGFSVRAGIQGLEDQRRIFNRLAKAAPAPVAEAAQILLNDLALFERAGFKRFNVQAFLKYSASEAETYQFHADRADNDIGRVICNYNEPLTRHIDNADAIPLGDALYRARPGARIRSFNAGDVVRMAPLRAGANYQPCLHQAPPDNGLQTPRLMMKADY